MLRAMVFSLVLFGCAREAASTQTVAASAAASPPSAPEATDTVSAEDGSGPAPVANPSAPSAQDLYAQCQRRVEGRQAEGECSSDADCATAGCSQEVCVTTEMASQVMTGCEIKPCFSVLDTCGCVGGLCSWSLKEDAPALELKVKLPPKDQAPPE